MSRSGSRACVHAILIASLVILAACSSRSPMSPSPSSSPLASEAVAGVTAPALRALLAAHWEWTMRASPTWASQLGDHRFDDQLPRRDLASSQRYRDDRAGFLTLARAIDATGWAAADQLTLRLLTEELAAATALEVCHLEEWAVSAGNNPLAELSSVVAQHQVVTVTDGANLLARLGQGARLVDETIANLRRGLGAGRLAAAEAIVRTIAQLDGELARPTAAWAMAKPAITPPAAWPADDAARFATALHAVIDDALRPALTRYRDLLRDELLPRGRTGAAEGVGALPDGAACYQAAMLSHLGVPRTAEELHALGVAEIARIDDELATLGARVLGTRDLADTIDRLRTDPTLYFDTGEALVAAAGAALARAQAAAPRWFGVLPATPCVIAVIPDHEAPFTTIAYYQPPHPGGAKPGEYFINTYRPEVRPRFELEALSWHEAVPGHHTQIALAQELGAVPAFRKHGGSTAYIEGWGLYTERLADEMGLYSSDLDRLGMVSYDAWRASRLVVDTGLHALGWTRAQAEAYMVAHTALTAENIRNEVDRYIGWPGQALAYKVGQLEIFALRHQAEAALGDGFDVRGFHDVVLGSGAVTLPILRDNVEAWIARGGRP